MSISPAPEYRRDPVSGRWVIIAPERSARPIALADTKPHARRNAERDVCPFCEGHEIDTPDEYHAVRDPGSAANGPGWQLRVVPNKFPAVRPLDGADLKSTGELFESFPGFGAHELVIECPFHESNPTNLTDAEFGRVFVAYRDRMRVLAADPRFAYVTVFKNVGAEAGASLAHLHSQIIATPIVPDAVRLELEAAGDYYLGERQCVFCDILREELADGTRVVAESANVAAICPFASRFAYEVWVFPKSHQSGYETTPDALLVELAGLTKLVLGKIDAALGDPAYNYFIHTSPARVRDLPYFHWHLEIMPRTARQAGFEWGSGCFINAVPPERAAAELRAATPQPDVDVLGR